MMKVLILLLSFITLIVPGFAIFGLLEDIFSIPGKIFDALTNPNIELDSRFGNQNINENEIINFNFGFGIGGKWHFGTWSNAFTFEKYGPQFDVWLNDGGKTSITKGNVASFLKLQLGLRQRVSLNWFTNWMTTFLNMEMPDNFKIKIKFGSIPWEVKNVFPDHGGSRLQWFLDFFTYLHDNFENRGTNQKIIMLIDIVIGKLKILTGQVKRNDAIVLTTSSRKITIPIQQLGESLTKYFKIQYRFWKSQTTQWLLNIFFQFLFPREGTIYDSIEIPSTLKNIFSDAKDNSFLLVLHLIDDVLASNQFENVSPDIIILMKYLRLKVVRKLPQLTITKWIIYNGKYIPIGVDGNVLTDIEAIKPGEKNAYIIKWVINNGVLVPVGPDDKPMLVEKIPKIIRWVIFNDRYIPIGEDDNPIEIKPLKPNEIHPFVLKWIIQSGKYIPENPDGSISDVKLVIKWILSNGLYIPLGENGELVPGLKPLTPGEKNIIITWKLTSNGLTPIGPDNKEVIVEEIVTEPPKQKIIRWIIINDRFFPIGTNGKPIAGVSPLMPGEKHPLVQQWITLEGRKIPITNDGSVIPIYTLFQFIIRNNKLIAMNSYGEMLPGIPPLTAGEKNLFVTWKLSPEGMIPIGPDGNQIPIKSDDIKKPIKIGKWIIINKKYVPIDDNGDLINEIEPLSPGEVNIYVLKWITINGILVPVGLNGSPMVVEQSNDETKLPSGFKIIWKYVDGKYVPTDSKGNVFYIIITSGTESQNELHDLMWKRFGKKYINIYKWLTPILDLLLTIKPETESLPIDFLLKAPVEITNLNQLPPSKDEANVLKWFENVLFTLTNPMPGADLQIGLLKYIQIFVNKIEQLRVYSHRSQHILVYEGIEIELDENGKPILFGQDGEPLFDFSKVPKEILEGNFKKEMIT